MYNKVWEKNTYPLPSIKGFVLLCYVFISRYVRSIYPHYSGLLHRHVTIIKISKSNHDQAQESANQVQFCWDLGANVYELVKVGALKSSLRYKYHIFSCMGKVLCMEFQTVLLKFRTKYLTHTLTDTIFIQCWKFRSFQIAQPHPTHTPTLHALYKMHLIGVGKCKGNKLWWLTNIFIFWFLFQCLRTVTGYEENGVVTNLNTKFIYIYIYCLC